MLVTQNVHKKHNSYFMHQNFINKVKYLEKSPFFKGNITIFNFIHQISVNEVTVTLFMSILNNLNTLVLPRMM